MSIICWYYDVSELEPQARFCAALAQLPWEERRQKVLRRQRRRDRLLCLGAGVLAWQTLLQAGAEDPELDFGPAGKPFLRHHPQLHFNLSHSGSLAVCAVGDVPVGVDVECVAPADRRVWQRCMSADEQAYLLASEDPERAFCRLWTRKESCLKLQGSGLDRPLSRLCVLPGCPWNFTQLELPGAVIAVCTREAAQVEFRPFRFFGETECPAASAGETPGAPGDPVYK